MPTQESKKRRLQRNVKCQGAVLFTGPDGIKDHKVTVEACHCYVGEGTMSPEGTSEVAYLWRAPKVIPHPRPKIGRVGEIGWGVPQYSDWHAPNTGAQISLGEFRQAVEDRHTHLYQSAWYPAPGEAYPGNSDAALVNDHKNDQPKSSQRFRDQQNDTEEKEEPAQETSRKESYYSSTDTD